MNNFLKKHWFTISATIVASVMALWNKKREEEQKLRDEEAMKQVDDMFHDAFKNRPVAFAVYPDGRRVGINADGEEIEEAQKEAETPE